MKVTINQSDFIRRFVALRPEQFSLPALAALFDYLDAEEDALGEEQFLDIAGICCEWTEYGSALAAAEAYGFKAPDSEGALWFLRDKTSVIEFPGGVLVRDC